MARLRAAIQELAPYAPGLAIAAIREKYGLDQVIKLASNENPLGTPPLALEAIRRYADSAFRYPQGGNPRLVARLAALHGVSPERIVTGNGSDEIIDLLIRMTCSPGDNIVCFEPCFSIYPIQARINDIQTRRQPLEADFSFDFEKLLALVDERTRLVFVTTPDNPSGYCPPTQEVAEFAEKLAGKAPEALLVIDEAYMDFAPDEKGQSLLASGRLPANAAVLRTFSKSYGLAGIRAGYGILPTELADGFWRMRLPFSLNILAEEAALAALQDETFRSAVMSAVADGREMLKSGLEGLGCRVWPSSANFLLFQLPEGRAAKAAYEYLLGRGIIIRALNSYNLPGHLRVTIGNERENRLFLSALQDFLAAECQE